MQAHWDFSIPAGTDIKSGDTMTVNVPDVLTLASNVTFNITDAGGKVIGHAVADHTTGKVTITLTDYAEQAAKNGITGSFNIWVHWDMTQVEQDTTVPVDWGSGGKSDIDILPDNGKPDDNEVLYKWGYVDANDPTLIHWTVRVNFAEKDIKNAVYTDTLGKNQTLVPNSIFGYHVASWNSDWTPVAGTPIDASAISETDATHFQVTLGELTDCVYIAYSARATDAGKSSQYENSGELTGDNIEKQTVDVYTPDNGGGGGGDTTVSVSGKKTWVDDNNASGVRPESVTIDLYQNGAKINSKVVTATDNWTYNFSELTKFDPSGKEYVYTVQEEPVDGYIPTVDGYNVTNTRINTSLSLTAKKVLEGKDLVSGAYQFELKDSDGKVIQTKSNAGTGTINFDAIKYDKAGTYSYTITEVKGSESGITYDTHEIKVTVTVVDKGGKLVATAAYKGDQTFTNKYTPVTPEKPVDPDKSVTPSNVLPDTGETATGLLTFMGVILMLAVTVWFYVSQKKKQI